jgi:hypothetical protein
MFSVKLYSPNLQCEGTPTNEVNFGPQCAYIAIKLDFKLGVPPSSPVIPPVDPPVDAPLEALLDAPELAPMVEPVVAPVEAPVLAPVVDNVLTVNPPIVLPQASPSSVKPPVTRVSGSAPLIWYRINCLVLV